MKIANKIKNGMRGVAERWGTPSMKRKLWDQDYASGKWNHLQQTAGNRVYAFLEKYARNGSILDLGCGSGNTANELNFESYRDYTGIDISEVALEKARQRSQVEGRAEKNRYMQSDVVSYVPQQRYDIILFRESVHYIPESKMKTAMDRYSGSLTEHGVIIVTLSRYSERRWKEIIEWIGANYQVAEKYLSPASDAFVIVFR